MLYASEALTAINLSLSILNIFKREHKLSRRHYEKSKNLRQITGKRQVYLCLHKSLLATMVYDVGGNIEKT